MATNRRRSRDDDDDDDDDRPRRRDDDDDDDDRPRARSRSRRDEDDEDDRPARRSRRRHVDDDDDDDRPVRRPNRKKGGPSAGLVVGIVVGVLVLIGAGVGIYLMVGGGANISYEKFNAITAADTIESLEKKFGKAKKLERSEWSSVRYADDGSGGGRFVGDGRRADATLADMSVFGVEEWYHWHSGSQDIYVATGKDWRGRAGLVFKVYTNSNAMNENRRAGADPNKLVPSFDAQGVE